LELDRILEEHIERFVRFPETLSSSEKELISTAINKHADLKELAEWFADFYQEIDNQMAVTKPEQGILLTPIQISKVRYREQFQILAAMTPAIRGSSFETVATLAAEKEGTVARILRHTNTRDYKLHLIRREKPTDHERTIFTIKDLGLDLVLNQSRHLQFKATPLLEKLDWNQSTCILKEPLGTCHIELQEMKSDGFVKSIKVNSREFSIIYKRNESLIEIHQDQMGGIYHSTTKILISNVESDDRLFKLSGNNMLSIPVENEKELVIQFFI